MNNPQATLKGLQLYQQAKQQQAAGNRQAAADAFRHAQLLLPNHPGILIDFARFAEEMQDWKAAEKLYRHLQTVKPDLQSGLWLAHALFRQEAFADAMPLLLQHLATQPEDANALLMAGLSASKLKQWETAIDCGTRLDKLRHDGKGLGILLNGLYNLGRKAELDGLLEAALRDFPDNPSVLAMCGVHLLKRGEYARGFAFQRAIRWRYDNDHPDMHVIPADFWDGKPFAGRLLIEGEQGLGDEILSSCMLNEVVRMGQAAVVECEPRLLPLYRRSWPQLDMVPRYAKALPPLMADGQPYRRIRGFDLAHLLLRNHPLPPQTPWLQIDQKKKAALRAAYRARWPGRKIVGISWRSLRVFHNGPDKSLPVSALLPLLARPDLVFVDVQYGDVEADLAQLDAAGVARPWRDPDISASDDIDLLAAQLGAFDLLLSVSNSTAHLAGATGAPGIVLLPRSRPVLWYWGYDGTGTPWYPSLQIVRNACEDDWGDAVRQVTALIERFPTASA